MTARPSEQEALARVYWGRATGGDSGSIDTAYYHPSLAVQIRCSLQRQRQAGVSDFRVAWDRAIGHLAMDHERRYRKDDEALLADPGYRLIWEAAWHRRPFRGGAAAAALLAALEPAEAADARHRHEHRSEAA
jgi:hypothetical protein